MTAVTLVRFSARSRACAVTSPQCAVQVSCICSCCVRAHTRFCIPLSDVIHHARLSLLCSCMFALPSLPPCVPVCHVRPPSSSSLCADACHSAPRRRGVCCRVVLLLCCVRRVSGGADDHLLQRLRVGVHAHRGACTPYGRQYFVSWQAVLLQRSMLLPG